MHYRSIIAVLLTSYLITSSSGADLIYWTHEFHVGDSFDMVLVDLELNGPNSTEAHFPGTNYLVTPDEIGLIITNQIMEYHTSYPSNSLTNKHDRLRWNQTSAGLSDYFYWGYSSLSYRPPFIEDWYLTETPMLQPSFVIYNDWAWQKNQVSIDRWTDDKVSIIGLSWNESIDIFEISYEVNLLGQFDHIQKKHVERVEEGYFKNTGILAYFNLFVDVIQDGEPVQYEILIANTQCNIDECVSRRGFLEESLNKTRSEKDDDQLLPSFSVDLPASLINTFILSALIIIGVIIFSKRSIDHMR